ncbi:MAG: hypothetical protein AAF231_07735 [Pseudomonadota bacterium]
MRSLIFFALFTTPAYAWDFTAGMPCLLTHEAAAFQLQLTYDPTQPLYSITVTLPEPWPDADAFAMSFDGPQGRVIGTDQHQLGNNGRSLTVTDKGFGNVLDGLQFNHTATAQSGDIAITFPLDGAAEPVAAFRACEGRPLTG